MTYYNTTNESGSDLKQYQQSALTQEDIIMSFFSRNLGRYTPADVHEQCFGDGRTPVTSVRRAMTNLTGKGKLRKTNIKQIGPHGRRSYTWERVKD